MLDERTGALLVKLNGVCREGGYQIVEEKELLEGFSDRIKMTAEGLSHAISYLREHGFLDVRYAEEGVYCLCLLPEGRLYFENAVKEKMALSRRERRIFLSSLLGAVCGSAIVSLFVWLIGAVAS